MMWRLWIVLLVLICECLVKCSAASACPPLVGDPAPPGCNKTFIQESDEDIPCWDDTDCPSPGTCEDNICNLTFLQQICIPLDCTSDGSNCIEGTPVTCALDGSDCPQTVLVCKVSSSQITLKTSPISGQSTLTNSCGHCSKTTCPPDSPCKRGKCQGAFCNRRGRCWCGRRN